MSLEKRFIPMSVITYALESGVPIEKYKNNTEEWESYKGTFLYPMDLYRIGYRNSEGVLFEDIIYMARWGVKGIKIGGCKSWTMSKNEKLENFDLMIIINYILIGKDVLPAKTYEPLNFDQLVKLSRDGVTFHYKDNTHDIKIYNPVITEGSRGVLICNSSLSCFEGYTLLNENKMYPLTTESHFPTIE